MSHEIRVNPPFVCVLPEAAPSPRVSAEPSKSLCEKILDVASSIFEFMKNHGVLLTVAGAVILVPVILLSPAELVGVAVIIPAAFIACGLFGISIDDRAQRARIVQIEAVRSQITAFKNEMSGFSYESGEKIKNALVRRTEILNDLKTAIIGLYGQESRLTTAIEANFRYASAESKRSLENGEVPKYTANFIQGRIETTIGKLNEWDQRLSDDIRALQLEIYRIGRT